MVVIMEGINLSDREHTGKIMIFFPKKYQQIFAKHDFAICTNFLINTNHPHYNLYIASICKILYVM